MNDRTWVILGATSIIAENFAHIAAQTGHHLRLVGRDADHLHLIAKDIELRFHVPCEIMIVDMSSSVEVWLTVLKPTDRELDLFLAYSDFTGNDHLNTDSIAQLITINISSMVQIIETYLQLAQNQHNLIYLSSVAACRGRSKNSLYGASKAAVEVYLEGLQQKATTMQKITIARLGFIDTKQTYGLPGIFYAAPPSECAEACWKAVTRGKRMIYFPRFWRLIMAVMTRVPFFIYKRMKSV